jgi:hypothetical protein
MRTQLLRNFKKGVGVFLSGLLVDLLKDRYIGAINRWLDERGAGPIHSAASWIVNRPFALTLGGVCIFLAVLIGHAFVVTKRKGDTKSADLDKPQARVGEPLASEERDPARLELTWHAGEKPYLHEYRMPNDPNQTLHRHYRVVVINKSKTEQAKDVEVILENLLPRTMDCVPCHLRLMNNILPGETPIEKFSLNPEGKQPIDVMMWRPDSSRFQIWHTVRQPTDVQAQPYTMKITASAANASLVSETFEIFKDGAEWNMRLVGGAQAKERLAPKLRVTGFSMPPITKQDGVWVRDATTPAVKFAWVVMVHNGSLNDEGDVPPAHVRAQIIYRPDESTANVISPVAWLGYSGDTIEIKGGTPRELVLAVETIFRQRWSFVTPTEFWGYNELWWHQKRCELEVRLIDDANGRAISPGYVFEWLWEVGKYRPNIRLLRHADLGSSN